MDQEWECFGALKEFLVKLSLSRWCLRRLLPSRRDRANESAIWPKQPKQPHRLFVPAEMVRTEVEQRRSHSWG